MHVSTVGLLWNKSGTWAKLEGASRLTLAGLATTGFTPREICACACAATLCLGEPSASRRTRGTSYHLVRTSGAQRPGVLPGVLLASCVRENVFKQNSHGMRRALPVWHLLPLVSTCCLALQFSTLYPLWILAMYSEACNRSRRAVRC